MHLTILRVFSGPVCVIGITWLCAWGAAAAVPSIISYSGRLSVSNALYTGTGQFKFALVNNGSNTTHQAAGVATVTSGFVTSIAVIDGGSGYTSAPAVAISGGGGSGATTTATVSGGAVSSFKITSPGCGYTSVPSVLIDPPPASVVYVTYWSNDGTSSAGSEPGASVTLPVVNGLFVAPLGDTEIANMAVLPPEIVSNDHVRIRIWFSDGVHGFAQLTPDHPLASTPYALLAQNLAGRVTADQLPSNVALVTASPVAFSGVVSAGQFVGNGAALSNLDATKITGDLPEATLGNAWKLGGNSGLVPGVFLGTTDDRPLLLKVRGENALHLSFASSPSFEGVNIAGGSSGNLISNGVVGGTIAGGGNTRSTGGAQRIGGDFGTIGGGKGNTASGYLATVAGGGENSAAYTATVGGGIGNSALGDFSTVSGGFLARAANFGQMAYASGAFLNAGDAQASSYVLRATTTSATGKELTPDGAFERLIVPENSAWVFDILIVARTASSYASSFSKPAYTAAYRLQGVVERDVYQSGPGTIDVIGIDGSPVRTVLHADDPTWSAVIGTDATHHALVISVTGAADTTIRWVATVRTAEVTYP